MATKNLLILKGAEKRIVFTGGMRYDIGIERERKWGG